MAGRKVLLENKNGVIVHRKATKKTLSQYVVIGEGKVNGRWKSVYRRQFVKDSKVMAKSSTYNLRQAKAEREKAVTGTPNKPVDEQLVEVKGLVSGEYKVKARYFHCEMLFFWYGREGFDEKKLLESAYEVMLENLPEIDRITFQLITSPEFGPDYQRWGIESVNPVNMGAFEQMEFEIFVPGAQNGRVLYNNVTWVSI